MHTRCQTSQVRSAPACEAAHQFVEHHLVSQARFMRDVAHCDEAKKQRIIEVSRSPSDTIVTTSGLLAQQRRRYHVARVKGQWSIFAIDIECAVCCGQGKRACEKPCDLCNGEGWIASCMPPI